LKLLSITLLIASVASAADFATDVYPLLQKAGCAGCHNHDGVASGTRLKFPETHSAAALNSFGRSLSPLVDKANPAKSLLVQKPTRAVAHAGGKRFEPGSPEEAALVQWAEFLATDNTHPVATEEVSHKPQSPVMRRLTHAQYNNTIRDLLGDDSRIADQFPAEDFVHGFRNQYESQSTSPLLAEAYAGAAEKLAKKAFAGEDISRIVPCKTQDAACRDKFIRSFGRKAFRRPLTDAEAARYTKLFAKGSVGKDGFRGGARMVVEAMLQSPNFLLRIENGQQKAWRPYETAGRLSYFLWNSMPDEGLLKSAENGELDTPEGVDRIARRMLKDPRASEAQYEFLAEWLRFDRLFSSIKDRRTFPQFTPELTLAMAEETRKLFSELVWNKRNFMEFYSAEYGFLNSDLARLYGVTPPGQDFAKVDFPASTQRAGILGQATFLSMSSKPAETSPTARGLFVREQFLCQDVPQPPAGVSTNLPALTKAKPQTTRERLSVHLSSESCSSCHSLIDPIGFGFEKFDALGQYREKQRVVFAPERKEKNGRSEVFNLELDTSGFVAGIKESAFTNPRELGKVLAASEQCQECVVKQVFRYAAGRHETLPDRRVIRKAYEDFSKSGFQFQELLVSLSRWMVYPPAVEKVGTNGASGTH
jgi:hypothetical protein